MRVTLDVDELGRGTDGWETIVAEGDGVISELAVARWGLVIASSAGSVDTVHRHDADGRPLPAVVGLDQAVSVADGGLVADSELDDVFVVVDSYRAPTSLWKLPVDGAATPAWAHSDADLLTGGLTVEQSSYPSVDGTEIGLFLVHRGDVTPSVETPTILNGYGGFSITLSPTWHPAIAAWCAAGGMYAVAGFRGGHEHGEEWHVAGSRGNKQNVFDDFHAAADHLVDAGLTSRPRLAISGRSNGGLLVGVALTQRPDLCRAVLCGVPLLDMVRFPQFLIAKLWTSEYGDPDIAEEFAWLRAYPRTTTLSTGRATRRRSCRRRRVILGSTRCTPARWWRSCRPRHRARTNGRSCSPRRVAPVTASASRCRSAPTSSPTPFRSSPVTSGWNRLHADTRSLEPMGVFMTEPS